MFTTRILTTACTLLAAATLGCSSTTTHRPERTVHEDPAIDALSAELVDAAALRATLSTMRVSVRELIGRDSVETYGPVSTAREAELASLGIALKDEFVSALSGRLHVLAPEPLNAAGAESGARAAGARATHEVVGQFIRMENELLVSLRLVDAHSSVIISSARGAVPLEPLIAQGVLVWAAPATTPRLPVQQPETVQSLPADARPATPVLSEPTAPGPADPYDPAAPITGEETASAPEAIGEGATPPGPVGPDVEIPSAEVEEAVPGPAAIRLGRLSDSGD